MVKTPASLLERLRRSGDPDAWARFVQLYTPMIYHWSRRAGLGENDAADLVQEVFVVLVREMPAFEYDPARSFRAWLKTVTLNKWREGLRRRGPGELTGPDDPPDRDPARAVADFDEAEYRRQLVARGLDAIRTDFEPRTWAAWQEYVVRGRPAAEVAAELGMTANAVYLAKSRVLRRLREELEGLLD